MKLKKISNRIIIGFGAFIVVGLILGVIITPQIKEIEYPIETRLIELISDQSIKHIEIYGGEQFNVENSDSTGLWCTQDVKNFDNNIQISRKGDTVRVSVNKSLVKSYKNMEIKLRVKTFPNYITLNDCEWSFRNLKKDSLTVELKNAKIALLDVDLNHLNLAAVDTCNLWIDSESQINHIELNLSHSSDANIQCKSISLKGWVNTKSELWMYGKCQQIQFETDSTSTISYR
jgi:hypothetical protein